MSSLIVNHNGDTAEALLKQYHEVLEAAQELGKAISRVECHGRNYPNGGRKADLEVKAAVLMGSASLVEWAEAMVLYIQQQGE